MNRGFSNLISFRLPRPTVALLAAGFCTLAHHIAFAKAGSAQRSWEVSLRSRMPCLPLRRKNKTAGAPGGSPAVQGKRIALLYQRQRGRDELVGTQAVQLVEFLSEVGALAELAGDAQ